ncbi:MAG: hypothetical protein V1903_10655 [Bacteroidota bacterium]
MQSKRPLCLIILFSLVSNSVFCQKIFREAYIMKSNGEILNGLVEYASNQDIPAVCVFKRFDIAVEITYNPGEIKEFGYISGNRYVSKIIENKESFYEVMVSGKITLYRKGSKYYIEKGSSGIVEISEDKMKFPSDGGIQTFEGLSPFLKYITEGKAGTIKEKINPRKDLIPIIAEYNKGLGIPYVVYNQEFSEQILMSESFRTGGNKNRFGISGGINIYSFTLKSDENFYYPDPEPEISIIEGLFYERGLSRKNDKLSIRADLLFLKQNFYAYSESTESYLLIRDDAFFEFTGVKLPVLLQYSFMSGKIAPFGSAGLSAQKLIQNSYLHIHEVENINTHEISTAEDNNLTFKPLDISFIYTIGAKIRLVNNLVLNVQGLVEMGQGLFNLSSVRQSSLQTTVLVGISF